MLVISAVPLLIIVRRGRLAIRIQAVARGPTQAYSHGIVVVNTYYENVDCAKMERRALAEV
jgi:hypothetical protein